MNVLICIAAAIVIYLLGGINPSIILSQKLYKTDIRFFGSHNPGFTNFLRNYGEKAWIVFAVDIAKGLLLSGLTALLFRHLFGLPHTGAAYASFFAVVGHAFPVWYRFHGGKSVAVFAGALWFIDWRAGIAAAVVLFALLAIKRYMSLAVICAVTAFLIALAILGMESPWVLVLSFLSAALIILRHRENIQRLLSGTESRFSLHIRKK